MTEDSDIIAAVVEGWGWTDLRPAASIETNEFGNVIIRDESGKYWRICPEELCCEAVAEDEAAFTQLLERPDFRADWEMEGLLDMATERFGDVPEGQCFSLRLPAVLGGEYQPDNLYMTTLPELLIHSGKLGHQVDGLADGETIEIEIAEDQD